MMEVTFKEIKTGLHLGQMQVTKKERRIQRSVVLPIMVKFAHRYVNSHKGSATRDD